MTDGVHPLADLAGAEGAPDVSAFVLTRPDAALGLVRDGRVRASAALWWRERLHVDGAEEPLGRIGHVAWATADDGAALLDAALGRLRAEGVRRALGPIDGSTWFAYRVVTDAAPDGGEAAPPFFLEPWPPPAVAAAFDQVGFAPVAHYLSARADALPDESAPLADDLRQLAHVGVTIRPFRPDDAEAELRALHPLLLDAFADNAFYAPLDLDRFLALYRPLLAHVDPDLVLVAEAAGRPVGVVLAVPDLAQRARGEAVDTVVLKTLAVASDRRGEGLGGVLARAVQEAARGKGYTAAVHALMHVDNASLRISRRFGGAIRRYALLGRDL